MNSAPIRLRLARGPTRRAGARKAVLGVDGHERDAEPVAESEDDLLALVLAHQPVVHEYAGELVPDSLVDEQRRHRVHAAGQPADHAPLPTWARIRSTCSSMIEWRSTCARSRRCPRGSAGARAGRTACGRPRGGTGSRRCRARRSRAPQPATRSRSQRGEAGPGRRRCLGATSSRSARAAGRRSGARLAPAGPGARTPPPRHPRRGRRARARPAACRNRCPAPGSASSSAGRARGALGVDRGRPAAEDRRYAACRATSSAPMVGRQLEEHASSRARRAISCEYWPP